MLNRLIVRLDKSPGKESPDKKWAAGGGPGPDSQ